jgi:hypothetical protein
MPNINNYSVSVVKFTVPEATAVSGTQASALLTIIPNPGYTATASDFSLSGGYSDAAVDTVVFSQAGLNVSCLVTFAVGFVMPSDNYEIGLCVTGDAAVLSIALTVIVNASVASNITGDGNEVNTIYGVTGSLGDTTTVFARNYTADSGFQLEPSASLVIGNQSNYNLIQTPTYNVNNNLTSITYTVNYTFPNFNVSGDSWNFTINSVAERLPEPVEVTSYSLLPEIVSSRGANINWNIFGEPGATYSASMTDGVTVLPIATGSVIGSGGSTGELIQFPEYTGVGLNTWTITLTGDLAVPFFSLNPVSVNQYSDVDITITASSLSGVTGFIPFPQVLPALQNYVDPTTGLSNVRNSITWRLFAPVGETLSTLALPVAEELDNNIELGAEVNGSVTNSPTLELDNITVGGFAGFDTSSLSIGDRFTAYPSLTTLGQAPFEYIITAINSTTNISVSPNITILDDSDITFFRTNGNIVDIQNASFNIIDDQTIDLNFDFVVNRTGDLSKIFSLDLDTVVSTAVLPVPAACDTAAASGTSGIFDSFVDLNPAGGVIAFLFNAQGIPDKMEIIHGNASGFKKATSSMLVNNNYGPFDNTFGTEPSNTLPTSGQVFAADQFIGQSKGTIPTKQAEFNADTSLTISSMTRGAVTYQQIVWWNYTAADYAQNTTATIRVTGSPDTEWESFRVCTFV